MAKLKEVRQAARTLREEHLSKKADLYAALEEQGKAKIVRRLIRAESQHQVYKKIKYIRNQDAGMSGLSHLKIPREVPIHDTEQIKSLPDTPDHWETIIVPEAIEKILLERNRNHFGQAEGTPFTNPPLRADVGYKADGYAADLILQGQIEYENMSDATSLLISHLQERTTSKLEGKITKKEVIGKLKNWKETTSTSPSGTHLGHYHCAWKKPQLHHDDPKYDIIRGHQEGLINATVTLLNYAIRFGYSFERWKKVINIMLQKDPGNPRIHRLRIIHIYEADYNLLLAVKWRKALYHAEDHCLLNDGLYGSRPGRSAHDPALMEVLQHELYRMSMKSGINFDLDATSCYDRILANIASLSSRRMGMDKSVVLVNTRNLESAKFYLKTNLGISEGSYQHCSEFPIHGTGQGSGNSPMIWCFVCSTLFDAFASQAHGATFTSYDNATKVQIYMIGFVDDCTQRVNRFLSHTQPTAESLITTMQSDAQLWNDLLWASGGALEQAKCSFHLVQTDWNKDGHPFLVGGTAGQNIYISDKGNRVPTTQKSNYTSHKTLGCYINPAHNQNQTWKVLQQKNITMANLLETNYFTRIESWTFYTAMYIPTITYPLPLTPLTKSQCTQLDTRFLRSLVPRCGYNRNMASAIRYAQHQMGGAGFKQLYVEQGTSIITQVFKFLNSPFTTIGKMLRMTISWTQAFLGTSKLFLTDVWHPIPPVGPSLLLDLRMFLREINASLRLSTAPISELLRQRDHFIMDTALECAYQWKPKHLIQINACRRFLQAQTMADITNLMGTRILPHALTGLALPASHNISIATFNQKRPGEQAWKTWRRFLSTIGTRTGALTNPLGPWTVDHTRTRHWPKYVYNPHADTLYSHHRGRLYVEHQRIAPSQFAAIAVQDPLPATGYPTSVTSMMHVLIPTKNFRMTAEPSPTATQPPGCYPRHQANQWENELLRHITQMGHRTEIRHAFQQGKIIMCSDGSAVEQGGSFGFVVATAQGHRLVKAHGPSPGAYPNSFRSESYGVLAALRWLYNELTINPLPTDESIVIKHYLDNKSVIQRIEQTRRRKWAAPNLQLQPEHDVIEEIVHTLSLIPATIHFEWVKGHQDQNKSFDKLKLEAQLNCEADHEASRYSFPTDGSLDIVTTLPHTFCQLVIQGKSITRQIKRRVYQAATQQRLLDYLKQKFHWNDEILEAIDWTSFTHIIQKYKDSWATLVKHIHDISPTGHIAHRNNPYLPHNCPACNYPQEDNLHVLLCPHPTRASWRTITLTKISLQDTSKSDPILMDILQDGLRRFHKQMEPPPLHSYPLHYTPTIISQNSIGWDQLYRGRWSIHWRTMQDKYRDNSNHSNTCLSGEQWVLALGRLLIDRWMILWRQRNEERHGSDRAQQQEAREQVVRTELAAIYEYKSKVCPEDVNLFYDNAEEHFAQHPSLSKIEDWIATHRAAIKASSQQATRLGIVRNRTLREYPMFNPISRLGA